MPTFEFSNPQQSVSTYHYNPSIEKNDMLDNRLIKPQPVVYSLATFTNLIAQLNSQNYEKREINFTIDKNFNLLFGLKETCDDKTVPRHHQLLLDDSKHHKCITAGTFELDHKNRIVKITNNSYGDFDVPLDSVKWLLTIFCSFGEGLFADYFSKTILLEEYNGINHVENYTLDCNNHHVFTAIGPCLNSHHYNTIKNAEASLGSNLLPDLTQASQHKKLVSEQEIAILAAQFHQLSHVKSSTVGIQTQPNLTLTSEEIQQRTKKRKSDDGSNKDDLPAKKRPSFYSNNNNLMFTNCTLTTMSEKRQTVDDEQPLNNNTRLSHTNSSR